MAHTYILYTVPEEGFQTITACCNYVFDAKNEEELPRINICLS